MGEGGAAGGEDEAFSGDADRGPLAAGAEGAMEHEAIVPNFDGHDVGEHGGVEEGGDAWEDILGEGGGGAEEVGDVPGGSGLGDDGGVGISQRFKEGGVIGGEN